MEKYKLPKCRYVKEKNGAIHKICPTLKKDMGTISIADFHHNTTEFFDDLPSLTKHLKNSEIKRKDVIPIMKLATKSFRAAIKIKHSIRGKGFFEKLGNNVGIGLEREEDSEV